MFAEGLLYNLSFYIIYSSYSIPCIITSLREYQDLYTVSDVFSAFRFGVRREVLIRCWVNYSWKGNLKLPGVRPWKVKSKGILVIRHLLIWRTAIGPVLGQLQFGGGPNVQGVYVHGKGRSLTRV